MGGSSGGCRLLLFVATATAGLWGYRVAMVKAVWGHEDEGREVSGCSVREVLSLIHVSLIAC